MPMKEWLAIIIIIAIVLIVADGFRRKRARNNLRMKLDKNIPRVDDGDDELLVAAELPSGGARAIPRQQYRGKRAKESDDVLYAREQARPRRGYHDHVPVLTDSLDAEDEAGVDEFELDDFDEDLSRPRVRRRGEATRRAQAGRRGADDDDAEDNDDFGDDDYQESDFDSEEYDGNKDYGHEYDTEELDDEDYADEDDLDADDDEDLRGKHRSRGKDLDGDIEEDDEPDDDFDGDFYREDDEDDGYQQRFGGVADDDGRIEPRFGAADLSEDELVDERRQQPATVKSKKDRKREKAAEKAAAKAADKAGKAAKARDPGRAPGGDQQGELPLHDEAELLAARGTDRGDAYEDETPDEVIVINVMAKKGETFSGKELLPVLMSQGLRLGDMSIFHRHADSNGNGPVIFSMANMVKPGTFDMASMEDFETPGLSLFQQLPSPVSNMKSFDKMLATARAIKEAMHGELKDENRSVLTNQTIEHYRQRIRDFELHQLAVRR